MKKCSNYFQKDLFLLGLSWCEVINDIDHGFTLYREGLEAINFALNEINSAFGKAFFDEGLPLKHGAFYQGWSTYLLGKKLEVQTIETRSYQDIDRFRSNCKEIVLALKKSKSPYLESYKGLAWPADMLMCIASLNLYNSLLKPKYENEISEWLDDIKKRLDNNDLIPHVVEAANGYPIIGARGNSQSLMLNFLPDIDAHFAREQFIKYKALFKDSRFGLPGLRHYPKGTKGYGDIDSGPVILGIGGVASIVGLLAFAKQKDWLTYVSLRNSLESFGVPITIGSKKRYIFGQLPMADAFICWSNSIEKSKSQVSVSTNWRLDFQILSIILCLIIVFILNKVSVNLIQKQEIS